MGQMAVAQFVSGVDGPRVSAFSMCSAAFDGVSWVRSGLVEIDMVVTGAKALVDAPQLSDECRRCRS